jgi:hypothetical protein
MSNLKLNPFAGAMALALPALCLLNGQAQAADVTLAPVTVTGTPITTGAITVDKAALPAKVAATSDTASMLSNKFYYLPTGGAYTGQGATWASTAFLMASLCLAWDARYMSVSM